MENKNLTDIYKWGWVVLIILAVFLGVKTLSSLKDLKNADPAYNSITVTGEGEVFAVPDIASFYFTVSADADTVASAQEQVTKKMDAILAAIKDMGIEEKDIKTSDYNVWPKYEYQQIYCIQAPCPPGKQVQDGYTASHSVTVKVRNTDKAGKALEVAGSNGATNLSGISFTIDDPDTLTEEARTIAIEDATDKAKVLAKQLGVKLVKVVGFADSSEGGYPMPYYSEAGVGRDMAVSAVKAPTLPTGENKTRVQVSVTYEIR